MWHLLQVPDDAPIATNDGITDAVNVTEEAGKVRLKWVAVLGAVWGSECRAWWQKLLCTKSRRIQVLNFCTCSLPIVYIYTFISNRAMTLSWKVEVNIAEGEC